MSLLFVRQDRALSVYIIAEMSIGVDLDWNGSGLLHILLNLDWIRTVKLFKN